MKLPRDVSGRDLANHLRRYGYVLVRQVGSHMRYASTIKGYKHSITIPDHHAIRAGTLLAVLSDVAAYLEIDRTDLIQNLFFR